MMKSKEMKIRSAGHPDGNILVDIGDKWSCGEIDGGVSIRFENNYGFVISFEDLEAVYLNLKKGIFK